MYGVLAPWDAVIRFESDEVHVQNLKSPYPLVRWTDRWGTRWEHRRGCCSSFAMSVLGSLLVSVAWDE